MNNNTNNNGHRGVRLAATRSEARPVADIAQSPRKAYGQLAVGLPRTPPINPHTELHSHSPTGASTTNSNMSPTLPFGHSDATAANAISFKLFTTRDLHDPFANCWVLG